jgi:hypothetical protein
LACVFLQQPLHPVSSACASDPFRSGIWSLRCLSNASPKVRFFVATLLPDELMLSSEAESHNRNMTSYPQVGTFAVDKKVHKKAIRLARNFRIQLRIENTNEDGLHAVHEGRSL